MLKSIKNILRRRIPSLRAWLIAIKFTFLDSTPPNRNFIFVIPRKNYWIVKSRKLTLLYPKEGLRRPNPKISQKYTYKNFVEVKKGDIVCDVGAFIGEFTLSIADIASKIILFEPDPNNYRILKRNTAHLKNITILRNPLWKENTPLEFKLGYPSVDSSLINVDSSVERGRIKLQAKRLDKVFHNLNLERIDFLKIDAEGAEPEVLEGAKDIFTKIHKIVLDCSPERFGKSTRNTAMNILKRAGFKIKTRGNMVFGWQKKDLISKR